MTVSAVWTIADIVNGLMAIPNLIALIALNGVVVADTKAYFNKLKADKTDNLGAKVTEFNKELSKDDSVAS